MNVEKKWNAHIRQRMKNRKKETYVESEKDRQRKRKDRQRIK